MKADSSRMQKKGAGRRLFWCGFGLIRILFQNLFRF